MESEALAETEKISKSPSREQNLGPSANMADAPPVDLPCQAMSPACMFNKFKTLNDYSLRLVNFTPGDP